MDESVNFPNAVIIPRWSLPTITGFPEKGDVPPFASRALEPATRLELVT
jgi:hypothetical protein